MRSLRQREEREWKVPAMRQLNKELAIGGMLELWGKLQAYAKKALCERNFIFNLANVNGRICYHVPDNSIDRLSCDSD